MRSIRAQTFEYDPLSGLEMQNLQGLQESISAVQPFQVISSLHRFGK